MAARCDGDETSNGTAVNSGAGAIPRTATYRIYFGHPVCGSRDAIRSAF